MTKQSLAILLSLLSILTIHPPGAIAAPAEPTVLSEVYAPLTDADLDALVAPIALYPDALVAQVLGAATYPDQVVEAYRYLESNRSLAGDALRIPVEGSQWDPAVQALTQFPTVLGQLARNITWTSALGDASANQQEGVTAAIQRMRAKAYAAGNLKSGEQITVIHQSPEVIVIQPAKPEIVYVPGYNPAVVYGTPVTTPGYSTGELVATSIISFGAGVAVGAAVHGSSCGWSYWGWGMSWGMSAIYCGGSPYYGNPYWWGGFYGWYYPGYRPPYYPPPRPPHPPPPGWRPPHPPGGGGPPRPEHPIAPPARPGGPTTPPSLGPGGRPGAGGPTTLPSPSPGTRPGVGGPTTLPAPSARPSLTPPPPPSSRQLRGYPGGSGAGSAGRPNAFSGSGGGRQQSMRGNRSMSGGPARPAGGGRRP